MNKKLTSIIAAVFFALFAVTAHAGSEIEGNITTNVEGKGILAVGVMDSEATVGGISVEGSKVKGDITTNVEGKGILAVGVMGSKASVGGVSIK